MLGKPKKSFTEKRTPPPRPRQIRYPLGTLFRMFVLGSFAVIGALWALWRHYTVPHVPMLVPAPSPTEIQIEP